MEPDEMPGNAGLTGGGDRKQLIDYSRDRIRSILMSAGSPMMEYELLGMIRDQEKGGESLYVRHFSLYHVLYHLADELGPHGWYLHLDSLRIRLLPLPGGGCCHYLPEKGHFCGIPVSGFPYCPYHGPMYEAISHSLSVDPLRDFYLNEDNIVFGDTDLLKKVQTGILVYSFRKGEVDAALRTFGLEKPDRRDVEKRYRKLAWIHHPDMGGDMVKMAEINSAYSVLREVFVL